MSMISNAMSGLNAANVAMTVAGQNVANAAVDGYSRQAASFATSNSPLGGVYVNSVDRIVDAFLNDDIWRTQSDLSYYQSKQTYLGYVEEIVGTDSLNFNDAVGQITNAFNAAASSPDSNAYRQQIISSSEGLIQDLAQMNGALSAQIDKLSLEMTNLASNTSSTAQQIADVNQSIVQAIANKQPTAELKDKIRDLEDVTKANPYQKIIFVAQAVDSWRIFPRVFLSIYMYLLYFTTFWFMDLAEPSFEQSA